MKHGEDSKLTVAKDIIMLERGKEELLLLNASHLQPMYIRAGRDYVKDIIKKIKDRNYNKKEIINDFPNDKKLINILIDHHILIYGDEKDTKLYADSLSDRQSKRRWTSLYLLLSHSCNLGCIYCLNGSETYKKDENLRMNEKVAFKSVEKYLDRLDEHGTLEIAFFGGEPLLNWPLAKKIINHCEDVLKPKYNNKKIKYHFTSNLSFLPDDLIEWAIKYKISFLCDVDGDEKIHNQCRPYKGGRPSHTDIVKNIGRLVRAGLYVSLRATVTSINQHHMLEIVKHHKDIHGRGSSLVPVNPINSDTNIMDDSLLPDPDVLVNGLDQVHQGNVWDRERLFPFSVYSSKVRPGAGVVVGCGAPYGNTPVVDANGDVYPCIYLVGLEDFHLGNILDADCPDETPLQRMMDFLHVDNQNECRTCPWRYMCGGGCPVVRLTVRGNPGITPKVRDYCSGINCAYTQKILEILLWEMAEEASSLAEETAQDRPDADEARRTMHC